MSVHRRGQVVSSDLLLARLHRIPVQFRRSSLANHAFTASIAQKAVVYLQHRHLTYKCEFYVVHFTYLDSMRVFSTLQLTYIVLGCVFYCRALSQLDCPAGNYCPTPGEIYNCTVGAFCAQGTVQPVTCNISSLLASYPTLDMPTKPTTVYESVYMRGTQLAGNECPANSSTPTNPCIAGYYCPTPGASIVCPAGYYCKAGTQEPSKCPALTNCPEGSGMISLICGVLLLFTCGFCSSLDD